MKRTTSTAKPTGAPPPADDDRDSCYFPGCRKDANCSCKMCIESINATLDLMPISVQKSSLTKLSTTADATSAAELTPISFGSLSTPTSRSTRIPKPATPPPSARSSTEINPKDPKNTEKESGFERAVWVLALVLGLGFVTEFWFSFGVFYGLVKKPIFSRDSVRRLGERSFGLDGDLDVKLRFLERSLNGLVGFDGKVSNCSHSNSKWEISQDGLLLNSHCKLYKSVKEEIRIWGWPLQTAGLLVTGFSSRSFTVVSGRVTEWSAGKFGYVTRAANTSWARPKWGSSAVQFDPNTWVLEYRRSPILENPRLVSLIIAFLRQRASNNAERLKRNVLLLLSLDKTHYCSFGSRRKSNVQVPT